MKKALCILILGSIIGYGIGYIQMQKELRVQELHYINQLEVQHCEDIEGVCD